MFDIIYIKKDLSSLVIEFLLACGRFWILEWAWKIINNNKNISQKKYQWDFLQKVKIILNFYMKKQMNHHS